MVHLGRGGYEGSDLSTHVKLFKLEQCLSFLKDIGDVLPHLLGKNNV
jgi:hypothetical protein